MVRVLGLVYWRFQVIRKSKGLVGVGVGVRGKELLDGALVIRAAETIIKPRAHIFLTVHWGVRLLVIVDGDSSACAYLRWNLGCMEGRVGLLLVLLLKHFLQLSHLLGVATFTQKLQGGCLGSRVLSVCSRYSCNFLLVFEILFEEGLLQYFFDGGPLAGGHSEDGFD